MTNILPLVSIENSWYYLFSLTRYLEHKTIVHEMTAKEACVVIMHSSHNLYIKKKLTKLFLVFETEQVHGWEKLAIINKATLVFLFIGKRWKRVE